jgi:hypothetical protein
MSIREASPQGGYPTPPAGGDRRAPWAWRESGPPEPPKSRLLDRVRQARRARPLSRRTEERYVAWIRCFIVSHPRPMTRLTLGRRRASSGPTRQFRRARTASAPRQGTTWRGSAPIPDLGDQPHRASIPQRALRHRFSMVPPNSRSTA